MRFFTYMIRFLTIRHITLCLIAPIFLEGCAQPSINPSSHMVSTTTLAAGHEISSSEKICWPEENWWAAYHDEQLNRLVASAIKGNPRLQAAKDRIALAQSMADIRQGDRQPQLELDAASSRDRFTALQFIPPPWAGGTFWNNSAAASLSFDLDLWGKRKSAWQSSVDETKAVSAEAQEVRIELENAIVRGYVELAKAYSERDIAEKTQANLEQLVAIERKLEGAGMGTQLAVNDAEANLPIAKARMEAIDEGIAHLKNEIAALAGEGPGAMDEIKRPELKFDEPAGLPDRLPANLIGRRPDVAASRWHVESYREKIKVAKAAFYPDLNLLGLVGFQAIGFEQWLSKAAFMAGAGPALTLPLFDGGKRKAGLSAANSEFDIAVDQYNYAIVQAIKEVSDQLTAFRSATQQELQAKDHLQKEQTSSELATEAYRAGLSSFKNVIESENRVLQAQENLTGIQSRQFEAYARLMLALGGGSK